MPPSVALPYDNPTDFCRGRFAPQLGKAVARRRGYRFRMDSVTVTRVDNAGAVVGVRTFASEGERNDWLVAHGHPVGVDTVTVSPAPVRPSSRWDSLLGRTPEQMELKRRRKALGFGENARKTYPVDLPEVVCPSCQHAGKVFSVRSQSPIFRDVVQLRYCDHCKSGWRNRF